MSVFAIYKYFFSKGEQNIVNVNVDVEETFARAQELFGTLFTSCVIRHTLESGEIAEYNMDIQAIRDDIVVLTLQNQKDKTIHTRNYDIEHHTDYPFCTVIIDNRPGVGQIAIERSSAFGSRPSNVYKVLFPYLQNKMLDKFHLGFEMRMKYKSGDFWDLINERRIKFKDPIKSVKFEFDNPKNKRPADATADMANMLINMASVSNADTATLLMRASAENELEINKTNKDLANLVELCANNTYSISVNFKILGIFNYGAEQKAMVIMSNPETIKEFVEKQTAIEELLLVKWLDTIRDQTADYCANDDTE